MQDISKILITFVQFFLQYVWAVSYTHLILEDLPKEYIRIEFKYAEKEDERLVDIKYIGNKEKEAKFNVDFGN